jgi:hypothetical protein
MPDTSWRNIHCVDLQSYWIDQFAPNLNAFHKGVTDVEKELC